MNNFLVAVLAVIAAIFGGLALVLFGKPKGSEQEKSDRVERVEPTTPDRELGLRHSVETEVASNPASSAVSAVEGVETAEPLATELPVELPAVTPLPEIADPWADESIADKPIVAPEMSETSEPAVETPEPEVIETEVIKTEVVETPVETPAEPEVVAHAPIQEAVAVTMDAPARSSISAKPMNSEAAVSASMPPFAAIHDPKRPSTPELQDLSQEILNMGKSQQLRFVPKLSQYANHSDPMIRSYVAYALGQIAAPHTVKAEIESIIPVLGKLSQDSNLEVRKMALKALSVIQSPKVLPYLEKGLLSSTGSVQQLANTAIQKLKLQYEPASSAPKLPNPQFPPALQKRNQ